MEGRKIAHFCYENLPWRTVRENVLASFPEAYWPAGTAECASFQGLSGARIWRLETTDGKFCLRGWPLEMRDAGRLAWMHRTLRAIRHGGCQLVPSPLSTRNDKTWVDWQGRFWELTPWMPGQADYHRDANLPRLRAAAVALATFHRVAAETAVPAPTSGTSPAMQRRAEMLDELNCGGLAQLQQALKQPNICPDHAIAKLGREILSLYPKIAPPVIAQVRYFLTKCMPLQPCHGDLWHDHVLFADARVTGLIDFGNLRVDTSVTDIARLLGSLVQDDTDRWRIGLEAYEQHLPLTVEQRRLLAVFDRTTVLLSGVNWIRWIYQDGRQFPWQTVQKRLAAILQRLRVLKTRG